MQHDVVEPASLEALPHIEAVVTRSAGFDHLPAAWMRRRGLPGYALGGYSTSSVAHLTLGFILMHLYRVPEAIAVTQGGLRGGTDPPRWDRSGLGGRHLGEATVGILGAGRIGGEVARLVGALGGQSVGYDIAPRDEMRAVAGFRYVDDLDALLLASDVLSLHVPLTEKTRGMIGSDEIARLPRGAVIVNTCRGEVIDQAAVEKALRDRRLGGYATDTLPNEPEAPDLDRFRDLPSVTITPHLAAYNARTIERRYDTTARIVRALLDGRPEDVRDLRVV